MPRLSQPNIEQPDFASIFTLGVVSGITSACCAPVLAGVLTLSFLAPSFWLAILIGAFYVLGMVFPLYVMSYFIDSKRVLNGNWLKKPIMQLELGGKTFPILRSNLISSLIFLGMGTLVIYLTLATDFSMAESAQKLTALVSQLQQTLGQIPYINVLFGAAVLAIFGFLWYQTFRGKKDR